MELSSMDDGFNVTSIGAANGTTQDATDALKSYLGAGLELCDDHYLRLTSNCPSGYGLIVSLTMQVLSVDKVTITFRSPNYPDHVIMVRMRREHEI